LISLICQQSAEDAEDVPVQLTGLREAQAFRKPGYSLNDERVHWLEPEGRIHERLEPTPTKEPVTPGSYPGDAKAGNHHSQRQPGRGCGENDRDHLQQGLMFQIMERQGREQHFIQPSKEQPGDERSRRQEAQRDTHGSPGRMKVQVLALLAEEDQPDPIRKV
jgi:hypothetical protein